MSANAKLRYATETMVGNSTPKPNADSTNSSTLKADTDPTQPLSDPVLDWIDRVNVSQARMLSDPAYRRLFEERIERLLSRKHLPGSP
jgi:hypothetical protein